MSAKWLQRPRSRPREGASPESLQRECYQAKGEQRESKVFLRRQ